MKKLLFRWFFVLSAGLLLLFLLFPDLVQRSAAESLRFCASVLIPSLFPGFVAADLLISLSSEQKGPSWFSHVFGLPSCLFRCFWIGLLAGFPAAADCACRSVRNGACTKQEAERCLAFTNNPGIVFVLCAVGSGMLGSVRLGILLWGIQTVAAICVGLLLAPRHSLSASAVRNEAEPVSLTALFPRAVTSSVASVLNVCGFVVFFRVLISVLRVAPASSLLPSFFAGLIEMTCGLSALPAGCFWTPIIASVLLGWSGCSVHFQILNVISSEELSPLYYIGGKFLQSILCFLFSFSWFFFISTGNSLVLFPAAGIAVTVLLILIRKGLFYGKRCG